MRNSGAGPQGPLVQSVDRAVSILEALAESPAELGITQLGNRLGVHKATASRLVSTLADHGLVERNPVTDKYRLGFGLVRLASAAASGLELVRQARLELERLAEQTRETVNLAALDGDRVVNIDQITAAHLVVNVNWVGKRTPLHCTSNGKVLLAHLPEAERERVLAGPLERLTPNTIVDADALRFELEQVRALGFASTLEELEVGLNAVAAPVRDAGGGVIAAVSVAGPAYRVRPSEISELARATVATAGQISRRMGYPDESEMRVASA
jgi:DNA-binding IclR family transcriptional regulator